MTTPAHLTSTEAAAATPAAATKTITTPRQLRVCHRVSLTIGSASAIGVVFVIIVGIILAISTEAVHAKSLDEATLLQLRTMCKQKTTPQLSDAEFKLITEHKLIKDDTTAAATPKSLQCYALCFLDATGAYKQNQPNAEQLSSFTKDAQKVSTVVGKCGKPTGADDCEKAFNFILCAAKETKIYIY